jgi:hypothetical protein
MTKMKLNIFNKLFLLFFALLALLILFKVPHEKAETAKGDFVNRTHVVPPPAGE